MDIEKECPICGNHFIAKRKSHVCCSRPCRDKFTRLHKEKECVVCGKTFSSMDDTLFCSEKCKHQYKIDSLTYEKECEYCGKRFQGFSFSKFCSSRCKSAVTRANHKEKAICENCGKEYEKSEYIKTSYEKQGKEYHSFCSHSCCIEYLYRTGKIKARYSKPHKEINKLLESMRIDYTNEVQNSIYCLDISLNDNQAIEIMGGYWHGDIRRFPVFENMQKRQKACVEKDKRKQKYFETQKIDILYLWEEDIKKDLDLCKRLINNFIKRSLPEYSHSSSYSLDNYENLIKNNNIKQYMQTT